LSFLLLFKTAHTHLSSLLVSLLSKPVASLRPELPDPAYGQNYIYAPNIAKLASESTVFGNAYCQESVCSPSRMSFLVRLLASGEGDAQGIRPSGVAMISVNRRD
jgi:hypothetical protein